MKRSVLVVMHELLVSQPEQEKALLSMLINKLGDPDRKIASKVGFVLQQWSNTATPPPCCCCPLPPHRLDSRCRAVR